MNEEAKVREYLKKERRDQLQIKITGFSNVTVAGNHDIKLFRGWWNRLVRKGEERLEMVVCFALRSIRNE